MYPPLRTIRRQYLQAGLAQARKGLAAIVRQCGKARRIRNVWAFALPSCPAAIGRVALTVIQTSPESDQRKNARQRVLKQGKIVSTDMQQVFDVKIRDVSASGARVQISANVKLPDNFNFLIVSERMLYPAVSRWRAGEMMGIEFVGKPRITVLRDSKAR